MKRCWLLFGLLCLWSWMSSAEAKPATGIAKRVYLRPVNCKFKECTDKKKHGNIHVVYANNKDVQITRAGNSVGNSGFGFGPKISPDNRTVGWVEGEHIVQKTVYEPSGQPGLNVWHGGRWLVLYRNGHILSRISGKLYFVEDWHFWNGGKQVVLTSRQSHGPGVRELHDVTTGRLIAQVSELKLSQPDMPVWARGANAADFIVIPGKSIGKIKLGAARQTVHKILGKPSHAERRRDGLTEDNWRDRGTIYFTEVIYQADRVVQVKVNSPHFFTLDGISTRSNLARIRQVFKGLGRTRNYEEPDAIVYFRDDVRRGIAFLFDTFDETLSSRPFEIIVHAANRPVLLRSHWLKPKLKPQQTEGADSLPVILLRTLKGAGNPIVFSPDGQVLVTGHRNTVKLWDVRTGQLKRTLAGHKWGVSSAAFSPDGQILASGGANGPGERNESTHELKLWRVRTGELLKAMGDYDDINSVAFSPDGAVLAAWVSENGVKLWDVHTGALKQTLKAYGPITFLPDGKTLASCDDYIWKGPPPYSASKVRLWDVSTGKLKRTLQAQGKGMFVVACSPDGKTLASAGGDLSNSPLANGEIMLWDVPTGKLKETLRGHTTTVFGLRFSPDGQTLATSGSRDKTVRLWDVQTGKLKNTLTEHKSSWGVVVEFSPDGRMLAISGGPDTVGLWRIK